MKDIPVAPFVDDPIGKFDRQRNSLDVGSGDEEIDLVCEAHVLVRLRLWVFGTLLLFHLLQRLE